MWDTIDIVHTRLVVRHPSMHYSFLVYHLLFVASELEQQQVATRKLWQVSSGRGTGPSHSETALVWKIQVAPVFARGFYFSS